MHVSEFSGVLKFRVFRAVMLQWVAHRQQGSCRHMQAGVCVECGSRGVQQQVCGHLLGLHGSHSAAFWCRCSNRWAGQSHAARQYGYLQQTSIEFGLPCPSKDL